MACALRLSQLIDEHNAKNPEAQLSKENIYVLEKAREVGQHCLSGALLDPRSMRELLPGFEKEAPLDAEVTKESVYFLTETGKFKFPITPPPMRDHGNYVISINRFVKWLGSKVEEAGITVFTGFAGSELLFDGNRVAGVRTDDKGVDKRNQQKSNFEPGYDLKAKVVILAEGTRGSLTKQLTRPIRPRTRSQSANLRRRREGVVGSSFRPHRGGRSDLHHGLSAHLKRVRRRLDLWRQKTMSFLSGFVTGLDYPDPRIDPQHVLQDFKQHPFIAKLLEGGKMIRYGAKSLPYGGWWAMPPRRGRWLDDSWRLRRLPELATAEGHSSRHQERHAGRGNGVRSSAERGRFRSDSGRLSRKSREQLDQGRAVAGAQFPPGIRKGILGRACFTPGCNSSPAAAGCAPVITARPGYERMQPLAQLTVEWRGRGAHHRPGEGRWQTHLRQADRSLSLRHQARRRSAGAPGDSRYEYLQQTLREGIRQSLQEFLSRERVRDGGRRRMLRMESASA